MVRRELVSEALATTHTFETFTSGRPVLDDWLRLSALHAQANRTARTFVWHRGDGVVVAWFSLSASLVRRAEVPKQVGRGSPDVIPAVLLARLALDEKLHGQGLGAELLADAIERTVAATEYVVARMLVVDALDEQAARFYERYGFLRLPGHLRLAQKIGDLAATLTAAAYRRA
jgi:GNAT superfamily N-acetyltransferase